MKRRSFLQKAAATTLSTCLPGALFASSAPGWHAYALPELLHILGDENWVRGIGVAYRHKYPEHNKVQPLINSLHPSSIESVTMLSPAQRLKARIKDDFDQGRTLQLNGWIVSLTEARQCALYSFLYS